MKIKNVLIILLFIFITSCNKYEYVDSQTRFNKQSGEIEKLSSKGEWGSVSQKLIEVEEQRLIEVKLKEERTRQRDNSLVVLPYKNYTSDVKGIVYLGTETQPYSKDKSRKSIILLNDSNFEIESLITSVLTYDVVEGDSTLISTIRDTILLDIDSHLGKPRQGKESYCCVTFPSYNGLYQGQEWSLKIMGWKGP